jgi:hypothetical protein
MRRPAQLRRPAGIDAPTPKTAKTASFPAPVGGWIKNQDLTKPGALMPDGSKVSGAFVLENFFPTATGVRMRRGSDPYAQVGNGDQDIVSMFAYVNGNNDKLFAATASSIYDITSPTIASHEVLIDDLGEYLVDENGIELATQYSIDTAIVSALAGGDWSVEQFATSGGVFLRGVNGIDTPLVYDGATWGTSPAITGSGLTANNLSYVWAVHRRLFFVEKNTLNAWYLPADAIGGAAVLIPLGGVFTRGGSLLFGASWSLETGNGLNEQTAFFSSEGEVAIYQGTDPSTAATWSKVGVYRVGKPRGAKSHIRAGGDLAVATDIGFVPLSVAVQRDYSALAPAAVSYKIETAWNEAVASRSAGAWSCEVWPTKQMVLVAPPTPAGGTSQMFVSNARTGAWGLFTGWNVTCLQLFGDRLFFGSTNGLIIEAEVTGADQGLPYTASNVPLFDFLKAPASLKTSLLMKQVLKAPREIVPQMSLQVDYVSSLPAAPDAAAVSASSVWGSAIWGTSLWNATVDLTTFGQWQSVGGSGYAVSPACQITSGNSVPPDVELVRVDFTYDQGDIVS